MSDQQIMGEQLQEAATPHADGQQTQQFAQERQVPLMALEAERAKRQQVEENNRLMQEHIALMQAQRQTPQAPKEPLESMDESDVMTYGDYKKATSKIAGQFQSTLDEMRMQQKNPDYQSVITKYLPDVLKQNPGLRASLEKSNDYELAYYLAKNSDSYKNENSRQQVHSDAERIIRNSSSAGSLASVGGGTPVAQARRYKDMSDADFRELTNRNAG